MLLKVNATRMELLKLKRRGVLAKKGHKLLKDKLEELLRRFIELVKEYRGMRDKISEGLKQGYRNMIAASSAMGKDNMYIALLASKAEIDIDIKQKHILNLKVPDIEFELKGNVKSYGIVNTSVYLDLALDKFYAVFADMVKLAELEKSIYLVATEIEKTKRRVNALEYKLIPSIEDTIRFITMKLDERERSNIVRLMKIKSILEQQE